jgi:hypothetical protein
MRNAIFWNVTLCGSCKDGPFGGTWRLHHQGNKNRRVRNYVSSNYQPKRAAIFLHSVLRLLVTANVVPSSPIFVTLMMEAIRFSASSVVTRELSTAREATTCAATR